MCRPDIGYAISKPSRYSKCPQDIHFEAVKRVYKYLRDTCEKGLVFWRREPRKDLKPGDEQKRNPDEGG